MQLMLHSYLQIHYNYNYNITQIDDDLFVFFTIARYHVVQVAVVYVIRTPVHDDV